MKPLLFIHIPKTAGTTISEVLTTSDREYIGRKGHKLPIDVLNEIGKKTWDEADKFTFVRNPWDRAISRYRYRRKRYGLKQSQEFNEWVLHPIKEHRHHQHRQWPQHFFWQEQPLVVGKFERLHQDLEHIIGHKLGELPVLRPTNHEHYSTYFNDKSIELIREWEAPTIERFNYEFEDQR